MNINDYSITDAEYLYMIRQMNHDAMEELRNHYVRLLWRRSHDLYNERLPMGTSIDDLHQEAYIGYKEAIYAFCEHKQVGLAFYLSMCVTSTLKTCLRKFKSGNFQALNPRYSLDIQIGEDELLTRVDMFESQEFEHDPSKMAIYSEAKKIADDYLSTLRVSEQKIHELRDLGFSYTEIAEKLDLSNKDVDNTVQKIRRNFQKLGNS